jgi:xylulokinase
MSFIGVDLGTSSVKAVLVDDAQRVLAMATRALTVSRPHRLWSEQDPQSWVEAAYAVFGELRAAKPAAYRACAGIGLSGHMHGATALDAQDRPLRPCILWNDGRAHAECAELEAKVPRLREIAGNLAMPGFTAPKLLWMRRHEPDLFAATRRVLLPKAYLRLVMTGEAIEDMSDASGTLWLDVARRDWSDELLAATGLTRAATPRLVEGSAPAGRMRPQLAAELGFDAPPLFAGGAGDNAAGAVALGAVAPGDCFLSLGTSGVMWRTTAGFEPRPESAAHAFCHAVPGLWHQMSVHLSAASCLAWWASVTGMTEAALLAELGETAQTPSQALFLPYLSGERTPHNDPRLRASFAALGAETSRVAMTQALLEGVAFAFKDGKAALESGGPMLVEASVIGGGSRSAAWVQILADALDMRLSRVEAGEAGGAFGAARLARMAVTNEPMIAVCLKPLARDVFAPDARRVGLYRARYEVWRARCRAS